MCKGRLKHTWSAQTLLPYGLGLVAAALTFGAVLLAASYSHLLDFYPYAVGGTVGIVLGYLACERMKWKPFQAIQFVILVVYLAPMGAAVGAFLNRHFDHSQPTAHAATVLEYERRRTGGYRCTMPSWRDGMDLEILDASLVPCRVGDTIMVRTRAGLFGWPWIESGWVHVSGVETPHGAKN
jgi:hypothetical protein